MGCERNARLHPCRFDAPIKGPHPRAASQTVLTEGLRDVDMAQVCHRGDASPLMQTRADRRHERFEKRFQGQHFRPASSLA